MEANVNLTMNNLVIKPYKDKDEDSIVELFHSVYGKIITINYWNWRFKNAPAGNGIIQLGWDKNILASHYAVVPIKYSIDNSDYLGCIAESGMTRKEYRRLGLFPKLAEHIMEQMTNNRMIIIYGFPNYLSHRTHVEEIGWYDIYEIPTMRLKLINQLLIQNESYQIIELEEFDSRFDNLWQIARKNYHIISCRDSNQLHWRYKCNPNTKYRLLAHIDNNNLLGYVVFKQYNEELQIVDILTASTEPVVGLALVMKVANIARYMNLDSVSLWLSVNTPLHRKLEKNGFQNDAPITYFTARLLYEPGLESQIYNARNWYITMGDSDNY